MPATLRRMARAWLPPVLARAVQTAMHGKGISFSGPYPDWDTAGAHASGYDEASILERVRETTRRVRSGEIPFERDSVAFDEIQYSFPVLAGLLRAAAEGGNRLSVLDYGGALGSSYYQCRGFLSVLESLRWSVVEQEHFVRCGQAHFTDERLRFHFTVADCIREEGPNAALLSGVMQFLPRPFDALAELLDSPIRTIVIDRTPMAETEKDLIAVQHVPPSIYAASYTSWIFARKPLLDFARRHGDVLAEFDSAVDGAAQVGTQEFRYRGMILRKR